MPVCQPSKSTYARQEIVADINDSDHFPLACIEARGNHRCPHTEGCRTSRVRARAKLLQISWICSLERFIRSDEEASSEKESAKIFAFVALNCSQTPFFGCKLH